MSSNHCSQPGLFDCIHDFVVASADCELTKDQWIKFEEFLWESDDACRLYLEYAQESNFLQTILESMSGEDSASPNVVCVEPRDSAAPTFPAILPALPTSLFHPTLGYSGWTISYLSAAVIVGLLLLGFWLMPASRPEQVAKSVPSSVPVVEPKAYVGRITGMMDCKIGSSRVSLGQRIVLASGLMEITYDTGAKVILQGPVMYSVEANGGYLAVGKLTGKLEKKMNSIPNPFSIRTPTAIVTDLGTEFGVEVSKEGDTETQVFVGAIKVVPSGPKNSDLKERVISAGNAVRVDGTGNQFLTVQPNERRFVRALLPQTRTVRADAYAQLVLAMKPFAYYRMEVPQEPNDTVTVFDSAPGSHHGTVRLLNESGGGAWGTGRFGSALWLGGPDLGGYAVVKDFPTTDTNQLSVSAWVYAWSRDRWAQIVDEGNSCDRGMDWQFNFSLYESDGDLMAGVAARNGTQVRVREGGAKQLPLGQWHHVVFVADGSVLHLYRNGIEVGALPCDGVRKLPTIKHLTIGCHNNVGPSAPSETVEPAYFWRGRIDEVAIFYHALSAKQVRQLYDGPSRTPTEGSK